MADRYRRLFLAFADAVLLTDAAGAIHDANTSAAWLLGYPAQELAGHSVREFLAPKTVEHFDAQWQTLNSFEHLEFDTSFLTAGRTPVNVLLDVTLMPSEDKAGGAGEELYVLAARQQSPREELEREQWLLRESAGRGFAGLGVASFFVCSDGRVTRYPPPAPDDKPRPLDWAAAVLTGPRVQTALARAWAGEEVALPPAWYSPGTRDPAEQRWLTISLVPLRRHGTEVTDVCARVLDDTARRMESEGQRWNDQQRHRDLLAEAMYHDLNNQLSVILAQASGLKLAAPPGQLAPPGVGAIMDAAQQAAALLRTAAAPHARGTGGARSSVDFAAILPDCAAVLAQVAAGRVTIKLELGQATPLVAGDEALLRTMVLALGQHMLAIMPAGCRLTLKTYRLHPGVAGMPASAGLSIGEDIAGGPGAHVVLADDIGPSADVELARAIVRAHSGRCESVSSNTQGTFWEVSIPGIAQDEASADASSAPAAGTAGAPRAARPEAAPQGPAPRVLLADDEENFRMFTSWALRERGYEVVTAKDGQEAFERFREAPESYSLVILDAYMPRMGGLEAYLRMQILRPDLPVLFASGFVRGPSVEALVSGCPGPATVLLKPFSSEDLLVAVKKALAPR